MNGTNGVELLKCLKTINEADNGSIKHAALLMQMASTDTKGRLIERLSSIIGAIAESVIIGE